MSAPNTNIEKQEKEHKGPLGGMALVIAFVAILTVAFTIWLVAGANEPGNDAPVSTEEQLESNAGTPAIAGGEPETATDAPATDAPAADAPAADAPATEAPAETEGTTAPAQ